VGADPRIGNFYNNPSFGYGGYCLPKDTKQLMANYADIPEDLISAIVKANTTRKKHIVDMILKEIDHIDKPTIGIYRLLMKSNSDNFRQSAIQDIITILKYQCNINIIIYEPLLKDQIEWNGCKVINNIDDFKNQSSLIVANRYNKELKDVKQKIYTRDIFFCN
jgi:UDPglucose 6-dehydrogenase